MKWQLEFDDIDPQDAAKASRAIVSRLWVFFFAVACFFLVAGFLVGAAMNTGCTRPLPAVPTRDRTA